MAYPSASAPLGTALSDFARRKPSEIPSRTQSVSAFLPGKVSMGAPFLRRITLQGMPPRRHVFPIKKIERRQAASKPVAFNASQSSMGNAGLDRPSNLECPGLIPQTADGPVPARNKPCTVVLLYVEEAHRISQRELESSRDFIDENWPAASSNFSPGNVTKATDA